MTQQKLYKLAPRDGYAWLFPPEMGMYDAEFKRLATGTSANSWWAAVRLVHSLMDDELALRPAGDFPHLASKVPVFSERARLVTASLLGESVEFLPATLSSSGEAVWVANILARPVNIDEDASEFARTRSGIVFAVKRLVCHGKQAPMFACPTLPGYYVSEEFLELLERSGLVGVHGVELGWSSR
jgi:hypothetical protein